MLMLEKLPKTSQTFAIFRTRDFELLKNFGFIVGNAFSFGKGLADPCNHVQIIPLPPNAASVHQPMDMGVISACKKRYRKKMLWGIVLHVKKSAQ